MSTTAGPSQSLSDALNAASRPDQASAPLIDQLAAALVVPAASAMDDDEGDEDLDLPMLMHPNRTFDIVPVTPQQRVREGRAALIGFAVGITLLVPMGLLMSSRLADTTTPKLEVATSSLTQSFVPSTVATDEVGIKTTKRQTQPVMTPAAVFIDEPAAKLAEPVVGAGQTPPASLAAPSRSVVASATPTPDPLELATSLLAKGDVIAARDAITTADLDSSPLAVMALAETFDPNMLAAWNVRGAHADVERARQLYARAFASGVMKARQRLEALE